ncbi:MAG: hypothetical protein LBT59_08360, partial [Clostridiales bacterium]|nr:hypothetical protein [Clostridiales bacterium]
MTELIHHDILKSRQALGGNIAEAIEMARVSKPVEERKQEIIDTAKALFIENGFDKTQVAE